MATDHARELNTIVKDFKIGTGAQKINIVGHSKGGLDARVFLANNTYTNNKAVANLIMIGTPNAGSPLAYLNELCAPAVYDIGPGAPDTQVWQNTNTHNYTIAGNWNPPLPLLSLPANCPQQFWLPLEEEGYAALYPFPNDGIVSVSSVESQGYFQNLGHTSDCHSNLLSQAEYKLAQTILLGG
jgi:PGAP1-like protein